MVDWWQKPPNDGNCCCQKQGLNEQRFNGLSRHRPSVTDTFPRCSSLSNATIICSIVTQRANGWMPLIAWISCAVIALITATSLAKKRERNTEYSVKLAWISAPQKKRAIVAGVGICFSDIGTGPALRAKPGTKRQYDGLSRFPTPVLTGSGSRVIGLFQSNSQPKGHPDKIRVVYV